MMRADREFEFDAAHNGLCIHTTTLTVYAHHVACSASYPASNASSNAPLLYCLYLPPSFSSLHLPFHKYTTGRVNIVDTPGSYSEAKRGVRCCVEGRPGGRDRC